MLRKVLKMRRNMKKIDKTYAFIGKSKYLCIVLSLPEAPNGRRAGGHTYFKGVTVRFVFDAVRIWQFEQRCQKQNNGNIILG